MRTLVAALLLFSSSMLGAQTRIDRGFRLDKTGSFRIYSLAGSIRIVGWARDSVHVRGSVAKGDEFRMGGSPSGGKSFVENADERNPKNATLEVFVPSRAKIWVKTASASVTVSGFLGSLDVYTVSGAISVTGNPDDVNAEAIDGNIKLSGSPRFVRAKSASGRVDFSGTCDDATLSTVSGAVVVDGGTFERGRIESVTGPIRFDGSVASGGSVVFDTHSGNTELSIPSGAGADIQLITIAGKIVNSLTSSRPTPGRYGRGAELNTTNGDGGAQLTAKSFKGNIILKTSR
jgi:DUF4097 and DUF4098 domain-containing protein YvlB